MSTSFYGQEYATAGKFKRKARDQDTLAPLDERARSSTIVQPANQDKCRADRLLELIREVADSASHMAYEASLLANAYFTRLLLRRRNLRLANQELEPLPADMEQFYYVCLAMCKHGVREATLTQAWERFPGLQETANQLYGVGILPQVECNNFHPNMLTYIARSMVVAVENYRKIALYDHQLNYFQAKHGLRTKAAVRFIAARVRTRELVRNYEDDQLPLELFEPQAHEEVWRMIVEEHNIFWAFEAHPDDYRWHMLTAVEERDGKRFSLLPLRSMGIGVVELDNSCLRMLWSRVRPYHEVNNPAQREANRQHMLLLEDKKSLQDWFEYPNRGPDWKPAHTIRVSEWEFHFIFERNVPRSPAGRRRRVNAAHTTVDTDFDPAYTFRNSGFDTADPTKFAACDIGHHNPFVAVSPTGNTKVLQTREGPINVPEMQVRAMSKATYDKMSGRQGVRFKQRRMLKRQPHMHQVTEELAAHTLKTTNFEQLRAAVAFHRHHWRFVSDFWNNKRWRKLKVAARIHEQRTIDKLVHYITWEGTKAIGWGDCSRTTGFRGLSPGAPMAKIRRHAVKKGYNVTWVNEFNTSKRCPICQHGVNMRPVIGLKSRPRRPIGWQGPQNLHRIHGMRTCPTCCKTWNRDFAAAINIWDAFYSVVRDRERPDRLL
jgi:hypothetical protein